MSEAAQKRQVFDIASLAEGVRAILIGRGWETVGHWCWATARQRRPDEKPRKYRQYIDLSRPAPARIPSRL